MSPQNPRGRHLICGCGWHYVFPSWAAAEREGREHAGGGFAENHQYRVFMAERCPTCSHAHPEAQR